MTESLSTQSTRGWLVLFWTALAVVNTISAFTPGPEFFGWQQPDGLSGLVAGTMWAFAIAELTGVRW